MSTQEAVDNMAMTKKSSSRSAMMAFVTQESEKKKAAKAEESNMQENVPEIIPAEEPKEHHEAAQAPISGFSEPAPSITEKPAKRPSAPRKGPKPNPDRTDCVARCLYIKNSVDEALSMESVRRKKEKISPSSRSGIVEEAIMYYIKHCNK